jgi:hypothetical protein
VVCSGGSISVTASGRTVAGSNLTFYVAPPSSCTPGHWGPSGPAVTTCGNDSTGNGTQGAPWATCQHAITVLYQQYDF